jgi:signal transduction histidine kinase/Na+/proline symporter
MISPTLLATLGIAYIFLLFLVAWLADRRVDAGRSLLSSKTMRGVVYALSLGVYCSSWTFYGAVGTANTSAWAHAPIYLGPILLMLLAWPVFKRMVDTRRKQRVTSLADYLSARFGKRPSLALIVTVVAVAAVVPYIALQFKALAQAWQMINLHFAGQTFQKLDTQSVPLIAGILAIFTVLFGARRLDGSERHAGVMSAIAFESMIKLVSFLVVAFFALEFLGEDSAFDAIPNFIPPIQSATFDADFIAKTLLSALAILCLPRQFHVSVVELQEGTKVGLSRWIFPLYLSCFLLLVIPISQAGSVVFGAQQQVSPDTWVQMIPLSLDAPWVATAAFIGGISAATSMAIIATLSLSIMLTNEVVAPTLMRVSAGTPASLLRLGDNLKRVRRLLIVVIMIAAWWVTEMLVNVTWLTSIGFMSFLGAAQVAPGLIAGLYWRRAHGLAVMLGMCLGLTLWFYTCVIPFVVAEQAQWLTAGPWGLAWLAPSSFLYLELGSVIANATFLSLGFNLVTLLLLSLILPMAASDKRQVAVFFPLDERDATQLDFSLTLVRVSQIQALLAPFLREHAYQSLWRDIESAYEQRLLPGDRAPKFVVERIESILADVIGVASAHRAMEQLEYGQQLAFQDLAGMVTDASKHNSINRSLLESAVENLTQGIAVVDPELRLVAWNKRYEELFDYPPRFLYSGCPIERVYRFNAQRGILNAKGGDIDSEIEKRLEWLREGNPHRLERTLPNGKVIDIRGNPLPQGGFVTTYIEVSDYHDLLAQLEDTRTALEAEVASGTKTLLETNTQLRKENRLRAEVELQLRDAGRSKSHFMSATSHDLLQPIHAARLFTASLQQNLLRGEEVTPSLVTHIDQSLRRAERLITDLREISRLDSGRQEPVVADVALLDVLDPVLAELRAIGESKGLILKCVPSKAWVRVDPAMLTRILQNLIGNAIRYTDRGKVLVGIRRRGNRAEIQVCDTGRGISPADQARVFQEFERVGRGDASQDDGLGLGLAIVQRYCDLLGITLDMKSEEGKGTVFSVFVPLTKPRVGIPVIASASSSAHTVSGRVLCLDNDKTIVAGMEQLLTGMGLEVVALANERDLMALPIEVAQSIDVALADYHLDDGVCGVEVVTQWLTGVGKQMPVVVISADDSDAVRKTVAEAGFRFIPKPVNVGRLQALISALLHKS